MGEAIGIQLMCAPLRNMNSLALRYCHGELCLTPSGSITACHRISSPSDELYERCEYGRVIDGKLELDKERFRKIVSSDRADDNPVCGDCFLRWNCAGGCMVQNNTYSAEVRAVVCDFMRDFAREVLIRRIENR
jgi:radical SAM protein with 4Fe4S-binding SPASM domain